MLNSEIARGREERRYHLSAARKRPCQRLHAPRGETHGPVRLRAPRRPLPPAPATSLPACSPARFCAGKRWKARCGGPRISPVSASNAACASPRPSTTAWISNRCCRCSGRTRPAGRANDAVAGQENRRRPASPVDRGDAVFCVLSRAPIPGARFPGLLPPFLTKNAPPSCARGRGPACAMLCSMRRGGALFSSRFVLRARAPGSRRCRPRSYRPGVRPRPRSPPRAAVPR